MQTILQEVKTKWLQIAAFVVIFATLPVLLERFYLASTEANDWFTYESIQVNEQVNFSDNTIDVLSFAEVKRPVEIEWVDVLYCKDDAGFEFVTSNESSRVFDRAIHLPRVDINPQTGERTLIPWRFDTAGRLETGEVCHITSTITAVMPEGVGNKSHTITSNDFIIQ